MKTFALCVCIGAAVSLLLFFVLYANASSSAAASGKPSEIEIANFSFAPETITVAPGTKITCVKRDDTPHKVVSTKKDFSSSVLDTGDSYSFTFANPGTYAYFCSIHPRTTGKVIVK